jgi:hypothetical protein
MGKELRKTEIKEGDLLANRRNPETKQCAN